MMGRVLWAVVSSILGVVMVGASLLMFGAITDSSVASASSSPTAPLSINAVANFQGCWSTSKTPTDVLVLMDTTASLQSTDPMALRVVGLEAALRAMALANAANPNVVFRVRIVGFSENLEYFKGAGLSAWDPVTDRTLRSLDASAQEFRSQKNGAFTNFGNALAGSEGILGPQQVSCKALLWFTDGANDESNNGQSIPMLPIERQNTSQICEPGGIEDDFVNDGIYSFAIGLTNETGSEGQRELQTIVQGSSPAGPDPVFAGLCGQNGVADSASGSTGHFFNSPTAQQLIFNMQEVFSPNNGGGVGPGPGGECLAHSACPAANLSTFWVGPGVKDFFIDTEDLGSVSRGGPSGTPQIVLTDEGTGSAIRIVRSVDGPTCYGHRGTVVRCKLAGLVLEPSSITNGELAVTGVVSSGLPASGILVKLAILTPATGGSTQYLFYETPSVQMLLVPESGSGSQTCPSEPAGSLTAYMGCVTRFRVELVDSSSGTIFGEGSLSDVTAGIPGVTVPVTVTTPASGTPLLEFTMPSSASPGPQSLRIHAVLHLGPKGFWPLTLGDTSYFTLRTQPGYPTVVIPSKEIVLSPGQSRRVMVTVLPGLGGGTSGGCVRIERLDVSNLAGLRASESVASRWSDSCVPLTKGRAVHFAVVTKLVGSANGGPFVVNLVVQLGSASTSGQRIAPTFHLRLRAFLPLNVGRSIVLLILLLGGGMLLLLGVALAVNYLTGRFAPLNVMMLRTYDVGFGDDSSGFGEPDALDTPKTFEELTSKYDIEHDKERSKRAFSAAGLQFQATMGSSILDRLRGLFNGATGTVREDGDAPLIVGSGRASTKLHGGASPIPLSLDGTWIFRPTTVSNFDRQTDDFLDAAKAGRRTVTGRLTFVVREGAGPSSFRALRQAAFWHLSNDIDQFGGSEAASLVDRSAGTGPEPPPPGDTSPLFDGL
jgi:hypothetical protein